MVCNTLKQLNMFSYIKQVLQSITLVIKQLN